MSASTATLEASARGATRFFWLWLFVATSMSVAGNVTHAVMNAPKGTVALAAVAAVVPPAVLVGSTESVALLIKTRRLGVTYWCALMMTVALAGCAFVLSFDALRDLAVSLGFRPDRAWLWPVAVDVSIAQSTLALLTLAPGRREHAAQPRPRSSPGAASRNAGAARTQDPVGWSSSPPLPSPIGVSAQAGPATAVAGGVNGARALTAVPNEPEDVDARVVDPAAVAEWKPTADQLVRDGITSKNPDVVAAILAEHAAGTPPSTIGRRQRVHHTTVGRIVNAAQSVTV
ncbi:MAG TPA: DUF2637 domain-containing protein [Mycobacterium sp.]|nr:DUF2637 domain-containing protein [Mycobacterium sp.]